MNAKERFYSVVQELGLNDYQLFTKIDGITKNMAYKLRSGLTEEVSIKILIPFLQAYPNVNANYILTGKGSMFISDGGSIDYAFYNIKAEADKEKIEALERENRELRDKLDELLNNKEAV